MCISYYQAGGGADCSYIEDRTLWASSDLAATGAHWLRLLLAGMIEHAMAPTIHHIEQKFNATRSDVVATEAESLSRLKAVGRSSS